MKATGSGARAGDRAARRDRGDGAGRARRAPFVALVLGLLIGGLALLLGLNTASAANELRRHALAQRDVGVAAEVQQLRTQIAASAAPQSLMQAAAQLGMVPATAPAFIVLGPHGSVLRLGKPQPAKAAALPGTRKKHPKKHASSTSAPHAAQSHTAQSHTAQSHTTQSHTTQPNGTQADTTRRTDTTAKSRAAATPTATPTPTPIARPTPTPTPTPTLTLTGGQR